MKCHFVTKKVLPFFEICDIRFLLSRQIFPFIPIKPPPLSPSFRPDGQRGGENKKSPPCGAEGEGVDWWENDNSPPCEAEGGGVDWWENGNSPPCGAEGGGGGGLIWQRRFESPRLYPDLSGWGGYPHHRKRSPSPIGRNFHYLFHFFKNLCIIQ